jgi:hypothetical protein
MKKAINFAVCMSIAALSAACGFERKSTVAGPSAQGINALLGTWTSSNIVPTPSGCSDFKWHVTEQTGPSAKGSFSATCTGDLKLTGNAQGTLNGSTITWNAQGVASGPGLTSCEIVLSGTAEITVDSVRVPYEGKTCLGGVRGTEVLKRS